MRLLVTLAIVVSSSVFAQSAKTLKPITAPKEATVKAVYFKGSGQDATGGTTAVKVRLSPNKSGEASVGVMEEFSGGTGDQWRTAVWQAAVGASSFNRVPLTDYEFLVRVGGHIDGPSAGLLMATTFVALQRGKTLKPNTTMTGTINPDGSSGPVGGIVQKMRGAAADGIKRFGFPIGGREQVDVTSGKLVDLLALAEALKIEAKELRTLPEAYEFLTGEVLPSRPLVPDSELELTVAESNAVRLLIQKVDAEYVKKLDEVVPQLKKSFEFDQGAYARQQQQELSKLEEKVDREVKAGALVDAYFSRTTAVVRLDAIAAYLKFWSAWRDFDVEELVRQLTRAGSVLNDAELLAREVDGQFPPGLVNDLFTFDIHEDTTVVMTIGLKNERLRKTLIEGISPLKERPSDPKLRKQLSEAIGLVLTEAAEARAHLDNARRFATVYPSVRPAGAIANAKPVVLERNEKSLYSSGTASLAYFDAIITSSAGAEAGLTLEDARAAFSRKDSQYGRSAVMRQLLEAKVGTPRVRFTAAYRLHFNAAGLANRYYSLESVTAADGTVTVGATKALTAQLDLARSAVLESCAGAKQAGWIPMMARIRYLSAMRGREGSDGEKVDAIESLWQGKFWCDLVQTAGR